MSLPPSFPAGDPRPQSRGLRLTLVLAGLVGCLLLLLCGVLLHRLSQDRWYLSQAVIEHKPTVAGGNAIAPPPAVQLEYLLQPQTLDRVVQMLELTKAYWNEGEVMTAELAREQLRQSMRVEIDARLPQLAFITVYDRNPNLAANLANTLAFIYRKHLMEPIVAGAEGSPGKARMEQMIDAEPVRIRQRAEPAMRPLPWWQGDPRGKTGITIVPHNTR
ncbi:MAG TPA: hypothetical protein VGO11_22770 [Chthoniobacteraceae bacterium]|jgi:hypothetical protein|nr:hypothetical protein [Chthoniobacteraceae bacterium]